MKITLCLLVGLLAAPAAAFIPEMVERLWPELSDKLDSFNSIAKIPYLSLLNDDASIDKLLLESMKEYGFFYVVDVADYDASVEQNYMKQFYDLNEDVKDELAIRRHNPANKNAYRGYCPGLDDVENTLQYKNLYNIGPHETRAASFESDNILEKLRYDCQEPNVWPETGNCTFDKGFKETFQTGFEIRRNIGRAFIRSIARSMEYPNLPALFSEDEFSAMGLRKYPIRRQINSNMYSDFDGTLLRELEHIDSTVTVLSTFNNGGLEILHKNQYRPAPVTGDNAFLVNIGKLVDDLIDNKVPSVRHRVAEVDFDRYSITYFLGPQFDADISRSMSGAITQAGLKYKVFGEWIKDYLGAIELFYY